MAIKRREFQPDPQLLANREMLASYQSIIRQILKDCELVDPEEDLHLANYELLCEIKPVRAWNVTEDDLTSESFKIIAFVAYRIEIGEAVYSYSPVRLLAIAPDSLLNGCVAEWKNRFSNDNMDSHQGTLEVNLPGYGLISFIFYSDPGDTLSDIVSVGDYRQEFKATTLRHLPIKAKLSYLQSLQTDVSSLL